VHDPSGAEVGRASSGDDGNVSFMVPGGAYYIESAVAPDVLRQAQAQAFSVPGGHSGTVTIEYDTGIR
jgi:hypothetical protein